MNLKKDKVGNRQRFHYEDNWFFSRLTDGSVYIERENKKGDVIDSEVINPDGWASIVASVSIKGDTAENFAKILAIHNGKKRE